MTLIKEFVKNIWDFIDGNLSLYAHDNCQIKHYNTKEK